MSDYEKFLFSAQCEVEEATPDEDFTVKWANCKKNPGHTNFIPIRQFTKEHLPDGYRDDDLCDMVKCLAAQTVKVVVKARSSYRTSSSTGRIRRVARFVNGVDKYGIHHKKYIRCPCGRCCGSSDSPPSDVWWQIQVLTARHVLFEDTVAEDMTCVLFYDGQEDVGVKVQGIEIVYVDVMRDSCEMICVTCDGNLAARLEGLMAEYDRLWPVVHNKFKDRKEVDKLTIIVSHPHRMSKRVSIGRWKDRIPDKVDSSLNLSQFTYNASTCPGSSGALVFIVGLVCSRLFYHHAHSKSFAHDVGLSGVGEEEYTG
ncbi:hypothetical protein Btru_030223 [Bulinus truncatus]|nr:hypothetical protein Btru_030223 [Bulinus truncatus]